MKKTYKSDAYVALHESASDLHKIGLMPDTEMQYFDDACLETIPEYTPERVKFVRAREELTQSQMARLLNVSLKTVQSWEAKKPKHPSGPAAKLLTMLERHGARAIAG
ncbi:MAG: transcriptional regulator [Rhodospirillales bacterium]|nr:transcriptional regulator [Rhodospirillales bacterium]